MSSLVGHGLAGSLASSVAVGPKRFRGRSLVLWLGVAIALVPDFDVIIWLLLRPVGIEPHRGFSHSLLFAFMSALVFAIPAGFGAKLRWSTALVAMFAAAVSHPVLDFLMGAGPGVRFLAPVSESGYLFPIRAVPTAYYGLSAGTLLRVLLAPLTLLGIVLEVLIFAPLILAASSRSTVDRRVLLTLSAIAWLLAIYLYNWTPVRTDHVALPERASDIAWASATSSAQSVSIPTAVRL